MRKMGLTVISTRGGEDSLNRAETCLAIEKRTFIGVEINNRRPA
jgi:hypothetical protein